MVECNNGKDEGRTLGRNTSIYSGKLPYSTSLNASDTSYDKPWITDSGATDHMTFESSLFITYSPCPSNTKVVTIDGSVTTVAGIGDVQINSSLTLKNVLHVPKLTTNLISIHKLTHDLCCQVTFNDTYCIFQEKDSGKTIGRAKEQNCLYYLELPRHNHEKTSLYLVKEPSDHERKVCLHHHRLGHDSFRTLQFIFPTLFTRLSVDRFHCDICEYAKNKRTNFPISKSRSLAPFHLVHSDVWGPSTIPNISGTRFFISFIDDCTRVTWILLMKNKSDVSHIVPNFFNMVKSQFGLGIN